MVDPEADGLPQVDLHGRISRAHENFKNLGAANHTYGVVESRIRLVDTYWSKFEKNDDVLCAEHWIYVQQTTYVTQDFWSTVEDSYLQARTTFVDQLESLRDAKAKAHETTILQETSSPRSSVPRIQLPQFTGRFEDWPAFRDLFIIIRDKCLTPVERLQHLKTNMQGETEQLIRCFITTEENFPLAWKALTSHYENQRLLTSSYCNNLLSLPRMKGESAVELRKIYHCMIGVVGSLKGIGRPVFSSPNLFIQFVVNLLDSRREWEASIRGTLEPSSYETFNEFLQGRIQMLMVLNPSKMEPVKGKQDDGKTRPARTHHAQKKKGGRCIFCQGNHFLLFCDTTSSSTLSPKGSNCLGRHSLETCNSARTCTACNQRHHTTLHEVYATSPLVPGGSVTTHGAGHTRAAPLGVLLATARVLVGDRFGRQHYARALLDPGSEVSMVSESLAQRLRVTRERNKVVIYGVGSVCSGTSRESVQISVGSRLGGASLTVSALVLPRLTAYSDRVSFAATVWPHLIGLNLADPEFAAGDPIDMLLGTDVYAEIMRPGLRSGGPQTPLAQQTSLGWILTGMTGRPGGKSTSSINVCRVDGDLSAFVMAFWEQEEPPQAAEPLSLEDRQCEEVFLRTVKRTAERRYIVCLPVTRELPNLYSSRRAALRSLESVERRFRTDATFGECYRKFLQEYVALGHMTRVNPATSTPSRVCYLPHHGVTKNTELGTKLRVVFNGSARLATDETLNQHLLVGPNLVPPLADVLLRWRRHRYAFVSDVEKMFRQIFVHQEDLDLQRILWRERENLPVSEYRLNTVIYGLFSAPYLATRTLRQLAEDEGARFPLGAEILQRDVYVDDVLSGADTLLGARRTRDDLVGICTAGGFPLRKWAANSEAVLKGIPAEHRAAQETRSWAEVEAYSTLGLRWYPREDCFCFRVRKRAKELTTRRTVLSSTAGLYDPLGFLAPVIVRAKIFVQSTWLMRLSWNDFLPEREAKEWSDFERTLTHLEQLRVPRWLRMPSTGDDLLEIHGFADASQRAYAAVVYIRCGEKGQDGSVTLALAKTRVAPLKSFSLPRLELCAATLLTKLVAHVRDTLGLKTTPIYLWIDSMVALGWIKGHPMRWTTFVANRVAEIQRALPDGHWRHVRTEQNPADYASRGIAPDELLRHCLWWEGPDWLKDGYQPSKESPESGEAELNRGGLSIPPRCHDRPMRCLVVSRTCTNY